MSANLIRIIIAAALLLHGIAHAVAVVALVRQSLAGPPAAKPAARTWLSPGLAPRKAALLALPFWAIAATCFITASLSFWGILTGLGWRQLAVAGAIIGTLGLAFFPNPWPGAPDTRRSLLDSAIALAVNIVILATQLWLHWPPVALFGK